MNLPPRFLRLLERDPILHAGVLDALNNFTPWMESSGTPFFPDYTRHDPYHVQRVLQSAAAIIKDEAWSILTPADAAVLIIAGLLHDSAIHLTEDGFVRLIEPGAGSHAPLLAEDRPWPVLWEEYISLARRFNAGQLRDLFGDSEPVHPPASNPIDWTVRDKLLIGDFLRRHHHRLAHEIAVRGVPGPDHVKPLQLSLEGDFADLGGLVARSHGMPLRETFAYLRRRYDMRHYRGVHAVFLMVLLRIADYLQVEAERAPKQLLQVKRLWSPFSLGKWKEHHAVRDIRTTHEDPEAIFVDALPKDVDRYIALQNLLEGLQEELDTSWAVLGEVYGRWDELRGLGLTSRRVRSTLDDQEEFARSVDYIPRRAAFETASGDLIPLLVEPLYGSRPEIGVRELLQNAVDAVRELWQYRKNIPKEEGASDVLLELSSDGSGACWLTVEDKGIGMSVDTVCSYFLRVGASFRRSDYWRRTFESDAGKSLVLRSGRFGVGALAAFLLGDEVEVSTRHSDAVDGIFFRATLSTENIELRRRARGAGTTVRVKLSATASQLLKKQDSWDWYCLSSPRVVRNVEGVEARQGVMVPGPGEVLPANWRRIAVAGYEDVQWTYLAIPPLICNGLIVRRELDYDSSFIWTTGQRLDGWSLRCPNVSIFDPDGRLPLKLNRTELADEELPFAVDLLEDVGRDLAAFLLLNAPRVRSSGVAGWGRLLKYPGLRYGGTAHVLPWFTSLDGTGLLTERNLRVAANGPVVVAPFSSEIDLMDGIMDAVPFPILWFNLDGGVGSTTFWVRKVLEGDADFGSMLHDFLNPTGTRLLIREDWAERLLRGKQHMRLPRRVANAIVEEKILPPWRLWSYADCPSPSLDFADIARRCASARANLPVVLAEVYPGPANNQLVSPLERIWEDIIGGPVIPYRWNARTRNLRYAFENLRPYLDAHRS